MERLPQKFEIWKYNVDEDKKVLEFCTEEVRQEIDKVSESIKEWFLCQLFLATLYLDVDDTNRSMSLPGQTGLTNSVGWDICVGLNHPKVAAEAITSVYNQQVDLNTSHECKINTFQKAKNGITRLKGSLKKTLTPKKFHLKKF